MKPKIIEDESEIPEGAVRMHLYNAINVLMPRGSMLKESIGPYLLDRLKDGYESWTDSKYGDNPSLPDLIKYLHSNLMGEVEQAWLTFVESALSGLSERDQLILKLSIMAITKPEPDSKEVDWLLETMLNNESAFVTTICFIDKYDRHAPEFAYFTWIHTSRLYKDETYIKMHVDAQNPETSVGKLFEQADYWNNSILK